MRSSLLALALALPLPALAQTTIYSFGANDLNYPNGLVADSAGNVYGGAQYFGSYPGTGGFYKIDSAGNYSIIFAGQKSGLGVVQGPMSLYGNTLFGASTTSGNGNGLILKLHTDGSAFTVIHKMHGADGAAPYAAPKEGPDGALYGTTTTGGPTVNGTCPGEGVIYRLTLDGVYTVLHTFTGQCDSDGATPSGEVFFSGATLYGTTMAGGPRDKGTLWSYATDTQAYTIIKSWSKGREPLLGGIGSDGTLYGTARANDTAPNPGSLWQISGGKFTLLVSNYPDLFFAPTLMPDGSLTLSSITAIYTYANGVITPDTSFPLGSGPDVAVIAMPSGGVYGTSSQGGSGYGDVFSYATPTP